MSQITSSCISTWFSRVVFVMQQNASTQRFLHCLVSRPSLGARLMHRALWRPRFLLPIFPHSLEVVRLEFATVFEQLWQLMHGTAIELTRPHSSLFHRSESNPQIPEKRWQFAWRRALVLGSQHVFLEICGTAYLHDFLRITEILYA